MRGAGAKISARLVLPKEGSGSPSEMTDSHPIQNLSALIGSPNTLALMSL
jgi:hypothetical protein